MSHGKRKKDKMGKSKYVAADKHGVLYNLKGGPSRGPWGAPPIDPRGCWSRRTHVRTHDAARYARARAGEAGIRGTRGRSCCCNNRDDVALVHVRVRDQLLLLGTVPVPGGWWRGAGDEGWMDGSVGLSGVPASCVPVGRGERTATVRTLMLRRMCVSRFRVAQRRCIVQQTSD